MKEGDDMITDVQITMSHRMGEPVRNCMMVK